MTHSLHKDYFYSKIPWVKNTKLYYPLKFDKNSLRHNFYDLHINKNHDFEFSKDIYYVRHIDYFLLGIVGSNKFLNKVKLKILTFLKGNLFIDIKNFDSIISYESFICFCGYKIILVNLKNKNLDLQKNDKLKKSLFLRLSSYRLNTFKLFLTRFYNEFLIMIGNSIDLYFKTFFIEKANKNTLLNLLNMQVRYNIYNSSFVLTNSEKYVNIEENLLYKNYFFDSFIFKVKKVISTFNSKFCPFISNSFLPIDLSFNILLQEFNFNSSFLYYSLFDLIEFRNFYLRSYFNGKKSFYSGLLFSDIDLIGSYSSYLKLKTFVSKEVLFFRFLIPVGRVILKLRYFGFFHPILNRAIGSTYLMSLEDVYIIKFFSLFSNEFLLWYKQAFDFYKTKIILEILKKSCYLTISRKHRGSKYWMYKVYTSNLLIPNAFYNYSSFEMNNICFNEEFFLKI
jgi:hypothetical protein